MKTGLVSPLRIFVLDTLHWLDDQCHFLIDIHSPLVEESVTGNFMKNIAINRIAVLRVLVVSELN
jgi:hypothetical protein